MMTIIIIIIIIYCNWVVGRWQWLFYMYTKCMQIWRICLTDCRQWKHSLVGADVSYALRTLLLGMRQSWTTWSSVHEFSRRLHWKPLERDKIFVPWTSRMSNISANHRTMTFRLMTRPTVMSQYCTLFGEQKTAVTQLSIPTNAQLQRHRLISIKNHLKNSYMFRSSTIIRELQLPEDGQRPKRVGVF